MNQDELTRFVEEYTEHLKQQLLMNTAKFPEEWNGLHVRWLAQEIARHDQDSVKRAGREIKKSMTYYELTF